MFGDSPLDFGGTGWRGVTRMSETVELGYSYPKMDNRRAEIFIPREMDSLSHTGIRVKI